STKHTFRICGPPAEGTGFRITVTRSEIVNPRTFAQALSLCGVTVSVSNRNDGFAVSCNNAVACRPASVRLSRRVVRDWERLKYAPTDTSSLATTDSFAAVETVHSLIVLSLSNDGFRSV